MKREMKMYEFKEQDAYDFARAVGAKTKVINGELQFYHCPYCHGGGHGKDKGTFAINLRSGMFKCQRAKCGNQGFFLTLARDFDFHVNDEFQRYYEKKKKYRVLPQPKQKTVPQKEAVAYLESRGISKSTAEKYQITARNDNRDILCFPIFNTDGKLINIKYRNTKFKKGDSGNKEWFEKNCEPYLYGVNTWNEKYDRFILTEGQLDCVSVYESGIENAFSVIGGKNSFTWYPACYDFLNQFKELIVFGDFENGEITLLEEMQKRFKKVVKHVREEDYKDCKDANEILQKYGKEQVRKCVENAVMVPVRKVIDLADVSDVDIYKLPKLQTGIKQLDRLLYGGIPFGGVVLVSGKPGQGKSTLASQILINAIYQGHKCFAYSGELPNYLFRSWIDFQAAGRIHITEYQNKWGDRNYAISATNRQMIADWYRGKCFLYDSRMIEGDEAESLLTVTENVIMQYGTDVVLLDNLMTALDLEPGRAFDKYDRQSLFVKKLARLALKYNALILLVAHKRKNNFSANENDEISGSGDISNLAAITIAYEKDKDLNPEQRLLKVSKNRLFGKVETDGYILDYDEKSKRIYGAGDDLDMEYGWDCGDGFEPCYEKPPF